MLTCLKKCCTAPHQHHLLECIEKGINDRAIWLLQGLGNPRHLFQNSGTTLLHYSIECRNIKILKHLLALYYNVNDQDSDWYTPLMLAVKKQDLTITKLLLKNNANIYITDKQGMSSLQLAMYYRINSLNLTRLTQKPHLILEKLFEIVNTDFLSNREFIAEALLNADDLVTLGAVVFGNIELARYILQNGYNIHYRDPSQKCTALFWATTFGKIENAKLLIENGACVNFDDRHAKSPLIYYIYNSESIEENSELFEMLLKCDESKQLSERHELEFFLRRANKKTLKTLLQSETDVSKIFDLDRSFLHVLIENKNDDVLDVLDEFLINYDVNERQPNGKTALMLAAQNVSVRKVEFLLKHEADVNMLSDNLESALFYAVTYANLNCDVNVARITKLLLEHGANPQTVSSHEETIIGNMVSSNRLIATKMIIAHLAMLDALDETILTDLTRNEIYSERNLKVYFKKCTQQLKKLKDYVVHGDVTLFDLLNESDEKMLIYARNKKFILALDSAIENTSFDLYYFNILCRKRSKAVNKIELIREAAVAIETLTGICSDGYYHIVYQIMSYLDECDFKNLCQVENVLL